MVAIVKFSPEVGVVLTLLATILADLVFAPRKGRIAHLTLFGLLLSLVACVQLAHISKAMMPLPPEVARTLVSTQLTMLLKGFLLILTSLAVALAPGSFVEEERNSGEFYALILFSLLGGMLCVSSNDLLMFFIAFELLSLPLYMLCGCKRYESASAEAGLKYFVNGALSSALLLYGISWIYGSFGSTELPRLAQAMGASSGAPSGAVVGAIMIMVALLFKVSAAPFHSWAPDVYTGAPPSVSTFLSTVPKVAIVGFTARLFWNYQDAPNAFLQLGSAWVGLFAIVSLMSMLIGNLSALPQTDARKILAYSGVAQIGYVFMGLAACSAANPDPARGLAATLFYVLTYGVANLGAWGALSVAGRGAGRYTLDGLRGLHQRSPLTAACLAVCCMSLAGVPPLAGFVGKFYLFRTIYQAKIQALVVFGILNSTISLFYYFKMLKAAYFSRPDDDTSGVVLSPLQRLALQCCLWSNVALGLWPGLMNAADRVAHQLITINPHL